MLPTIHADVCIAGAGIIGLSLALELRARGLSVSVIDAGAPMRQASSAAAGMLAASDPHNPLELSPLAQLGLSLYPDFLECIAQTSGRAVPFQTSYTLQALHEDAAPLSSSMLESLASDREDVPSLSPDFEIIPERSIDTRQLAAALIAAVSASSIAMSAGEPVLSTEALYNCVRVSTSARTIEAANFADCTGAWASDPAFQIFPIKGQMLSVAIPKSFALKRTVRTRDLYIVPRTIGPHAGRAIIGATIEDAGFDKTVHAAQIDALHRSAIALLPQLANASIIESWSGLRPATPDRLPLLGPHPHRPRHWIAAGHYRNGILLAPATAHVMAELLLGEKPSVDLQSFNPSRAILQPRQPSVSTPVDIRPPADHA